MQKSCRLVLKPINYDKDLIDAHLREDPIIDPADIFETRPRQIIDAVHREHRAVLKRKLLLE